MATFVIVVLVLHLLQPDDDPRYQLMSELAIGRHGWAIFLAFSGLAVAVLGLQVAIAGGGGPPGYQVLLGAAASLFFVAGVFPLDATTLIHISAIAGAFVLSFLAMVLFPTSAGRASPAGPRTISWSPAAGMAACVAAGHAVIPMGVGQRLVAVCLLTWLATVGWKLYRS